jgi:hypothetical protein
MMSAFPDSADRFVDQNRWKTTSSELWCG